MKKVEREEGHYWIKYKGKWTVGEFDGHKWALPRIGLYKYQSQLDEVGHRVMRNVK